MITCWEFGEIYEVTVRASTERAHQGAEKLSIEKHGSVELDGREHFGQDIHAGTTLQLRRFGKVYRTPNQ